MATKRTFERYLLWQATPPHTRCVISAHAAPAGATFPVPAGMTVYFYVAPGTAFNGTTSDVIDIIRTGASSNATLAQSIGGNPCPDYSLGKLQGYHKSDWGCFQLLRKAGSAFIVPDEEYSQVQTLVDFYDPALHTGSGLGQVDIATVRYRPGSLRSCRFSDIVADLATLNYTEVHCAFCR
jgi:hypothetical protein